MGKTGIIGILNNPACSYNSHSYGWNMYIERMFDGRIINEKDDWDEYDELIICHGPNFSEGSFNVIGGIQPSHVERITKLNNFKGKIKSVDKFDVNEFISKRKINDVKFEGEIEHLPLKTYNNLTIGDSHSLSIQKRGWEISRNDGKTLFGFLRNPDLLYDFNKYDNIEMYFGNIDVRFHLPRQKDPIAATQKLVEAYVDYCHLRNIKPTCLLPIESESRKLPKSGQYHGLNFFGSQALRSKLVEVFNNYLINNIDCNQWPEKWYKDLSFYEKEVMEPRQSVHIRPKHYSIKQTTQDVGSTQGLLF